MVPTVDSCPYPSKAGLESRECVGSMLKRTSSKVGRILAY